MFAQRRRLPDKLRNREQALRETSNQAEEPARSGSYVICQDGSLIPVEDPELLEIITRQVTPERM